jgi:hypothetical protein
MVKKAPSSAFCRPWRCKESRLQIRKTRGFGHYYSGAAAGDVPDGTASHSLKFSDPQEMTGTRQAVRTSFRSSATPLSFRLG